MRPPALSCNPGTLDSASVGRFIGKVLHDLPSNRGIRIKQPFQQRGPGQAIASAHESVIANGLWLLNGGDPGSNRQSYRQPALYDSEGTSPSVISSATGLSHILRQMSLSPQLHKNWRIPRFRLTETTPAVLQFQNGLRILGELHVVSRNGGLLLLPASVHQGSVVDLMFHTHRGQVFGRVEMLVPVSSTQQPFRFVALPESDQRTLQTAFQSGLYRNIDEEERIEELRAAVARWNPTPRRQHFAAKLVGGLIALAGCLVYAFYIHLLPH